MTPAFRLHRGPVLSVICNLATQFILLLAFASAGEWRVLRFMAVCTAQVRSLIVLVWFARRLLTPARAEQVV